MSEKKCNVARAQQSKAPTRNTTLVLITLQIEIIKKQISPGWKSSFCWPAVVKQVTLPQWSSQVLPGSVIAVTTLDLVQRRSETLTLPGVWCYRSLNLKMEAKRKETWLSSSQPQDPRRWDGGKNRCFQHSHNFVLLSNFPNYCARLWIMLVAILKGDNYRYLLYVGGFVCVFVCVWPLQPQRDCVACPLKVD